MPSFLSDGISLNYEVFGDGTPILLIHGFASNIEINWKTGQYAVIVNGNLVAKDGDTFCPVGDDRIAFYSNKGGRLSAPLPTPWSEKGIAAVALYSDSAKEVPVTLDHGKVAVDAPTAQPIVVFRDGAGARKKMGMRP